MKTKLTKKYSSIGMIILGMILLIAILPMISATETFTQNELINFKVPCFYNGSYCSSSSTCNLTMLDPNHNIVVNNQLMTNQIATHNYSLAFTSLGSYIAQVVCCEGIECKGDTIPIEITPTGSAGNNTSIFLIFALGSIIILIVSFIFKNNIFAFFAGLLFLSTGIYSMIVGFGNVTNQYTQILSVIIIGIGAVVTIISALDFIEEMAGADEPMGDE